MMSLPVEFPGSIKFVCVSGDVLNIDPLNFYSQLYKLLPRLHAGQLASL